MLELMVALSSSTGNTPPPHVMFIVGDDVGYSDFGFFNDNKTITPTIDGLLEDGIFMTDYYTFKICSPSRAAMITGRYPWGAGFYNMAQDDNHCTTNSTALPELLKPLGYSTHALGKWDVGYMKKECSPTYRGFDTFFGYYLACEADYWYHASPGEPAPNCSTTGKGIGNNPTDLSNSTGIKIAPAPNGLNGTYNTRLLADEAARLVRVHDNTVPFYMYLAFMAVHDGCAEPKGEFFDLGKQAPMATVERYGTTILDTYKVAGAMYTEMDSGIETVITALKDNEMWENTVRLSFSLSFSHDSFLSHFFNTVPSSHLSNNFQVLIFVSDNGGPLDHCTNEPLRGGKHTFFEGGVRVMSFISGPLVPPARRGTRWSGMAASADWYKTITEGIAGGTVPADTGYRPPDALNLWPAIMDGSAGPRTEVVHQVNNQYICDVTQNKGGCAAAIRMGEMKLIINGPGDSRTIEKPEPCVIQPPAPNGYKAPCPGRGIMVGCALNCGASSHNCQECFQNQTLPNPPLITATPAECQAACAADKKCGYFQWMGTANEGSGNEKKKKSSTGLIQSKPNQCIFKCSGAMKPDQPTVEQCIVGRKTGAPGGSWACGPKRNDSSAKPTPPPPAPPAPTPQCPVPFGLTTGVLEAGTDHARANGLKGNVEELICKPWCLFNLTSDLGERNDLGQNPAFQEIAQKMAARLQYHASTGPMPAYIWPNATVFKEKKAERCAASVISGYIEPIGTTTLLLD